MSIVPTILGTSQGLWNKIQPPSQGLQASAIQTLPTSWAHSIPLASSSMPIWLLPQGLLMCCSLSLEYASLEIYIACSFLLVTSQFQCHFLRTLLTTSSNADSV